MSGKLGFPGFTLIEVILVLSIVIILTLISIPVFTTIIKNYRIGAVADSLIYSIQYARTEAIKRNANVYITFVTGDSWCYGINTASACNCTITNNCNLGTTKAETAGQISLSTAGLTSNSIYFEGTHGAANLTGNITFTLYNDTPLIKVTIKRFGNTQVCSTGISGYTAC